MSTIYDVGLLNRDGKVELFKAVIFGLQNRR